MSPTRRPHTAEAREALHRALRFLDRDDPRALDAARKAAQAAADAVPYRWQAPYCAEYRHNVRAATCQDRRCTRCATYRAGDPMPPGES